jgi:hypothetical protein
MASVEVLQYCKPARDFPIFCRVLRDSKVRYVKVTHPDTIQRLASNKSITLEDQLQILQQLPEWNDDWKTLHVDEENGELKCQKDTFQKYPGPNEYTTKLKPTCYKLKELEFVKRIQNYAKVWKVKLGETEYYAKFVKDLHVVREKADWPKYVTPWETKVVDSWNKEEEEDEEGTKSRIQKVGFINQAVTGKQWEDLETEIKAYGVLEGTSLTPKLVGYISALDHNEGDRYIKDPGFETHDAVGILLEDAGDATTEAHYAEILNLIDRLHCQGVLHNDLSLDNFRVNDNTIKFIDFEMAKFDNCLGFWKSAKEEKEAFVQAYIGVEL